MDLFHNPWRIFIPFCDITMKVTVFTPTYNRGYILPRLYESLCRQTCRDFEWVIVDDGSTDGTEDIVSSWMREEKIPILYQRKENGGKHTAINRGVELASGDLFFIVDSDDYLTDNAVETIVGEWIKVKNSNLCGMSFQRGRYINGNLVCKDETKYPEDCMISNYITMKHNRGTSADNAEVWVTKYMREHPFTVYPGERFMSEAIVWIRLAKERDMLCSNKIIYVCEYLEGGLTDQGKKLRFLCPKGGIEGSLETMSGHFNFRMRIKQTLLYIVYSKFDGRSAMEMMKCPYKGLVAMCLPVGLSLYHYWKRKFFGNGESEI